MWGNILEPGSGRKAVLHCVINAFGTAVQAAPASNAAAIDGQ